MLGLKDEAADLAFEQLLENAHGGKTHDMGSYRAMMQLAQSSIVELNMVIISWSRLKQQLESVMACESTNKATIFKTEFGEACFEAHASPTLEACVAAESAIDGLAFAEPQYIAQELAGVQRGGRCKVFDLAQRSRS